jgi:hypothetical protein
VHEPPTRCHAPSHTGRAAAGATREEILLVLEMSCLLAIARITNPEVPCAADPRRTSSGPTAPDW